MIRLQKANGRGGKLLCFTKQGYKLKLLYRFLDLYMDFFYENITLYIKYVNDPFRNAKLILCLNICGFYFYILGSHKLKLPLLYNMSFISLKSIGNAIKIKNCNEGDFIFNLSFHKNSFGQICRSAGKFAQLIKLSVSPFYSLVKLKNNNKVLVASDNKCILGVVNNIFYYNLIIGSAGFNANYGVKSNVRGIAMNPIDHPNGGRTSGGKVYRSFSFKIARSFKKTRKTKKNFYFC